MLKVHEKDQIEALRGALKQAMFALEESCEPNPVQEDSILWQYWVGLLDATKPSSVV